nr:hypothetical protein [uncultured Oscillibacter sp.]
MAFPKLPFPLTADIGSAGYWIGDAGPYKDGAAVAAFSIGGDLADKTCPEVGARAVFKKKIQHKNAWRLYKRAYKNITPER